MNENFRDSALPLTARLADLLARLTTDEKLGLMTNDARAVPRLSLPEYDWWSECLHGVGRAGTATVFPQTIGLAATFDTALLKRLAEATALEARAKHHEAARQGYRRQYQGLTFFSPNVNIFRDPRWGRGQETFGEDPYLSARLGVAFITGLQGDYPEHLRVAACVKHFAVHSGPEALRHVFDARVSERDLHETYLPAFRAAVTEARSALLMGAYNRTNG
ncbi:MAG: glycoside hydrolase family 3 N-terminal domain-containing protein, partial [Spirochaetales bacterium]